MNKINLIPSKRLGQNFLVNKNALRTIIEAADIKPDEVVLEIGPGTGILTLELAKKAKRVIAVEKDAKMCEILEKTLKEYPNVQIINDDIRFLEIGPPNIRRSDLSKYKIVANIPYYLTSPIIRKFLEAANPPKEMILMVQKEVAQRICAKPPKMSILAVSVQFYAEAKIVDYVSRKSFWPSPKVDSAIIKIIPIKKTRPGLDQFFKVVKAGFSHPRKQLINNLSTGLSLPRPQAQIWLQENKIQPSQRAETLTVADWIKLVKSML
ncbi:MAG: 16S rRNA (adenine(1518)-N(6)/adenine(1519)-N(6))-dimethyltransferase RsmA [Patescibacteria group bacterium]